MKTNVFETFATNWLPSKIVPLEESLRKTLETYALARSAVFALESWVAPAIELLVHRKRPRLSSDDPKRFKFARQSAEQLLRHDVDNILKGVYPLEVLKPESPLKHVLRLPEMLREGLEISRRRAQHKAHDFEPAVEDLLRDMPEYYRRNFHYQGSGYLSERSARLYEHQVEILFAGTSDAMRRLIIEPLRGRFGSGDGEGLHFLEVASGTGRGTRFVRLAFPKAKITSLDLSPIYLKKAQRELSAYPRHDFFEGDAAHLPFLENQFDAVYSFFLFHELPLETRHQVISESLRVLKTGGLLGLVDSLQLGDVAEFDGALEDFPKEFHEPFYKNYVSSPMEHLFEEHRLRDIDVGFGFLSKVCTALK